MLIRPAGPQDVPGIVAVHVAAWDATKEGLDLPSRRSPEERALQWRTFIADGVGEVWVSEDADGVWGFMALGLSRDEDRAGQTEIYSLYVDPRQWGRGIGSLLMGQAPLAQTVSLWVSEGNDRARGFYAHHGFVPDGAQEAGHHVPVMRVVRNGPGAVSHLALPAQVARDGH